ncbi:MAG TPA: tRNA (N(6)-L-threonylcarbamoyladenosine(37)-C(2))-methylthiotransferase [Nitrososphaera sp.]|nr:tRNA (N(6)-L-threonylcarbamoyladenosine(37)-C(2))-methylthiotransferase [Nitrososphaera sp.]
MLVKSLKPTLIDSIPVLKKNMADTKPRVWVEAYGCSASMADSEMISGLLRASGYELADRPDDVSLNVIVTCSVKDASEHRMLGRIDRLAQTGKPLVVAGCLPKADRRRVESLSPSASLMGPASIDRIVEIANSALAGDRKVALEDTGRDKINIPRVRLNQTVSIVEVASGCLSECTFCQTKLAKGMLRSYRIGDIIRQIESDVKGGCREVWLTSTDNGCYGIDFGSDLVELLSASCKVPGAFWIRVGMMNPMYLPRMQDRLVDLFRKEDKLFKFIHVPVESGSDRILRKMKRGHTSKIFLEAVRELRRRVPEMTIATDVIVGFPGETEDDFEETLGVISESRPDIVNISRYGARPGTAAAKSKGRVSSQVAKSRSERLHILAKEIAESRNELWIGWEGEVLVDELAANGSVAQGRNFAYKPVVLRGAAAGISLGDRLRVKVYDFSNFSLRANVIPQRSSTLLRQDQL